MFEKKSFFITIFTTLTMFFIRQVFFGHVFWRILEGGKFQHYYQKDFVIMTFIYLLAIIISYFAVRFIFFYRKKYIKYEIDKYKIKVIKTIRILGIINLILSIIPLLVFFSDYQSTSDIFELGLFSIFTFIGFILLIFPIPSIILSYNISNISLLMLIRNINIFSIFIIIPSNFLVFIFLLAPNT